MTRKLLFYNRHGVEEYYLYDPMSPSGLFRGWLRDRGRLRRLPRPDTWTSPRLGITFENRPVKEALTIRMPDGRAFETYVALFSDREAQRSRAVRERRRATRAVREKFQAERDKAQAERDRAQAERDRAQAERDRAQAERERTAAVERAERLAARLRELGRDDD